MAIRAGTGSPSPRSRRATVVHDAEATGERPGDECPHRNRRAAAAMRASGTRCRRCSANVATPSQIANHNVVVGMEQGGSDQSKRHAGSPAAQECGDRQDAEGECELPGVEIAPRACSCPTLESRGGESAPRATRPCSSGADRGGRRRGGRRSRTAPAFRHTAPGTGREVPGRHARKRADALVHERQPRLGIDDDAIARKERRIEMTHDRRPVKGQVRSAISVARRVGGRENDERQEAERSFHCSSAVGP